MQLFCILTIITKITPTLPFKVCFLLSKKSKKATQHLKVAEVFEDPTFPHLPYNVIWYYTKRIENEFALHMKYRADTKCLKFFHKVTIVLFSDNQNIMLTKNDETDLMQMQWTCVKQKKHIVEWLLYLFQTRYTWIYIIGFSKDLRAFKITCNGKDFSLSHILVLTFFYTGFLLK